MSRDALESVPPSREETFAIGGAISRWALAHASFTAARTLMWEPDAIAWRLILATTAMFDGKDAVDLSGTLSLAAGSRPSPGALRPAAHR